ncbi:MAG: restriction endonuclease subunit S [Candidatus Bathyarchaeota archaeon]|nr:restriction endonuclease subunit S [Candidatus Bathyarchaeota archaeon]
MKLNPYPNYKKSGIEWFDVIPQEWHVKRLKHISNVRISNVDKKIRDNEPEVLLCNYNDVYKHEHITSKLKFMKATASLGQINKLRLRKDDVIITKDSEEPDDIAVPALVTEDLREVVCGYHLALVRPDQKQITGDYLFRSFQSKKINDQFTIEANGVTRFGISTYPILNAFFLVPSKDEQRNIMRFLDLQTTKIDDNIARDARLISLLNEKRIAVINHIVTSGLDPQARLIDSGVVWIGSIPENWKVVKAKLLFSEINSRSIDGHEELLTVSHITGVTRRSEKKVTMFLAESFENYKKCKKDDLVINTMWAWMGAMGIAKEKGIVSPAYNVYRMKNDSLLPAYCDLLVRTPKFISIVKANSKGIWDSRLRLYPEYFFEIYLPIPPREEQVEIAKKIRQISDHYNLIVDKLNKAIALLNEYRESLLDDVVTGKVNVQGATA